MTERYETTVHDKRTGHPVSGCDGDLIAACRRLLREYVAEEEDHGFPFNFALRDAHRELRRMVGE